MQTLKNRIQNVLSNPNTYECFLNMVSQHAFDTCNNRTHVLDYVLTAWTVKRLPR